MAYPLFHSAGAADLPTALTTDQFAAEFDGETDLVEFKQGISESKVREAVTAFSNTDGGVILLGVRDDGVVQGISTDGETTARVHRVVAGVRSPGRYDVRPLSVGKRAVLVLSVERRREGFAQMLDGRILVRRGAMNVPLFDSELARFVSERALTRFEATPVRPTLPSADADLIDCVRAAYGWSSDQLPERLAEAGLLESGTGTAHLTVAGALYLLPRPADVLGKAYVEVFRYRDESETYDRRFEISGPANQQVEEATRELMSELGSDVVVVGTRRHELPRIPEAVLREAVANAVAHRTYEVSGQSVRIEIRPDRVVIRSPGGLPEPVTLNNMREQSAARNVDVIRTLRRFRLAEDAGMGIDVMEDAMEAALLEPPEFDADSSHVQVALRIGSAVTPQERAWISEIERRGDIRTTDHVLLVHAARGELLTNRSVRDLLGIDSVHARASLQRLRDLGYLSQRGQLAGAVYSIAKGLAPPAGLELDDAALRLVILDIASGAQVTNESVRVRTGLDRVHVLSLLNSMVESGELVRRGSRRGTYYETGPKALSR